MKNHNAKILMLLENPFPFDARVKNEAYTLTDAGYRVSVIAQSYEGERRRENVNGVSVYRVPHITLFKKSPSGKSRFRILAYRLLSGIGYVFEYFYFTATCFVLSLYLAFKVRFDVIHVHNPPNTLFLIGMFYKLFGKKFVFDHHDLAPELFLSKYGVNDGFLYKALVIEEKLCLKFANLVIATNESYRKIDITRSKIDPQKVFIVRNGPDLNNLRPVSPDKDLKRIGKSVLVYVGIMGQQDGVDYLLQALHELVYDMKRTDFYCLIIGRGDALENLKKLATDLMLDDFVRFTGFIPKEDLIRYLSTADICLDPDPSSPLNDSSTWVKIMEYMSFSKPIVSFDLRETRYSAQNAALYVTPNKTSEFAKAIAELLDNPEKRKEMGESGYQRVKNQLAWEHSGKNLLSAYEWLQLS